MTISLAILGLILAASGSLVVVASRAVSSDASNQGSDASAARAATSRVIDDLKVATAVTEQTATAVTMTVPDRDADGQPETIRYAWTGVAGDPLTRTYNGVAGTLAENVRGLDFTYLSKTAGKPPPAEGAEVAHASHAAAASGTVVGSDLTASKAVAEYFQPTLSSKAVSWKVTRCRIQMQRNGGAVGTVTVSLKYADANRLPTGAALQSTSILIAGVLTSAAWVDASFATPATLDVSKGVCLVVTYASVSGSGGKVYYDNASTDGNVYWMTSSDGGTSWGTPVTTSAMQFAAYGTVTTQERETLEFQPLPPAP